MTRTFQEYQQEKREREWKDKVQSRKEALGNAERVKRAGEFKEIGNDKFKSGNLMEARDYYREAIIYVEDLVDARRKERNDLLIPLYSNLAQVYLRLEEASLAEEVCTKALVIAEVPRNEVPNGLKAKAQFRRGVARRSLGKTDEAKEDLQAVLRLQPDHAEVLKEMSIVKRQLAEKHQQQKAAWGGFLQKDQGAPTAAQRQKEREERQRQALQRRKERLRRAEERQQMEGAFEKLSKGKMLYEAREKEMEPVRKKEEEKKQTLELEQQLLNIIDESKGKPKTDKFEEFMKQKEARAMEQSSELDQKKKVLDKVKKEEQWAEDDQWRQERLNHRKQLESRGAAVQQQMWAAKQVDRWCQQRLRETLVSSTVQMDDNDVVKRLCPALCGTDETPESPVLRALITDVLKLDGDASVIQLNDKKQPLHYFDYFLKMDWEVHLCNRHETSYRPAEELITEAAHDHEQKAPKSVAKNMVLGGTVKIREFSSEELPHDGLSWPLLVKEKRRFETPEGDTEGFSELILLSERLRDELFQEVKVLLRRWVKEYHDYWA